MKRINKIVSAFLNLLQVASYVSLCACSGNPVKDTCIQTAGDLLSEEKEPENVQNKEVSNKSNEAEKNLDKLTNLLAACQSCKGGNNKDKCAKDDKETCSSTKKGNNKDKCAKDDKETCSSTKKKAKNDKKPKVEKVKTPRSKRNKSSISEYSVDDLKTTPIVGDLSIAFDVTGKLEINNCLYRITNANDFKACLEYLKKAKKAKKSIKGLDSIYPKGNKALTGNNDLACLWQQAWFWEYINEYWDLFAELKLAKFSITNGKKGKVYIDGLGLTDFSFSNIVTQKGKIKPVTEIKDKYNKVFHIKADTPRPTK